MRTPCKQETQLRSAAARHHVDNDRGGGIVSAHVQILPDGDAIVRFDFSYAVVEELKDRIPAYAREYDPKTHEWTIAAGPFVSVVIDVLADCFGKSRVHVTDDRSRERAAAGEDPYTALHLLPTAPPELVQAAYKILARLNHPDAGGDTLVMQQINAAVATLRDRAAM